MQPFVHLHVHSQYSLLDGQASIQRLVDKAMKDGMKALALTDHGAMYGIKEFVNYVSKKNAPVNAEIKNLRKEIDSLKEKGASPEQISERQDTLVQTQKKLFKPIIGCECYVARRNRFMQSEKIDGSGWHLVVLAKNLQGYKNLIKIVSK
ncbi:MAG TPA: DNA polymerase III subunit alpha, partial [Porphyromonadaceae bacterium]|nr:DNA polymerase III subunit alpha [Porphyromonadaceae bacterium]